MYGRIGHNGNIGQNVLQKFIEPLRIYYMIPKYNFIIRIRNAEIAGNNNQKISQHGFKILG